MRSTDLISSGNSTELARVTVSAYDCKHTGIDNSKFRLGSGTKIDKFQDLQKICVLFILMYFSTCTADKLRETIEKRWRKLRTEPLRT